MANKKFYIIPNQRTTTAGIKEKGSNFTCPANTVMTGRYHKGDENGQTQYATALVKIDGKATLLEEGVNSSSIKESSGIWFKTDAYRVMTGRHHKGDENGQTYYTSAKLVVNKDASNEPAPPGTLIVPDKRQISAGIKESESYFYCGSNMVMTGRMHTGDENGTTQYEYATLKAVTPEGESVIGTITVEDVQWETVSDESSGMGYDAPLGRVIVGRSHSGDENGKTRYQTGIVLFNGNKANVVASSLLPNVRFAENRGIFFISASRFIIVGRKHSGDENGETIYTQGYIYYEKQS